MLSTPGMSQLFVLSVEHERVYLCGHFKCQV